MTAMAEMTEQQAFEAAIRANPDDDLARLVYADWLEENGNTERAEFIRVQVELVKHTVRRCCSPTAHGVDNLCRPLRGRERELWEDAVRSEQVFDWFRVFGDRTHTSLASVGEMHDRDPITLEAGGPRAVVRRGFVAEVRCTLAEWCGGEPCRQGGGEWTVNRHGGSTHRYGPGDCDACNGTGRTPGIGPQVVAAHPVQVVTLTDREPMTLGTDHWWYRGRPDLNDTQMIAAWLPEEVFDLLPDGYCFSSGNKMYRTDADAFSAASHALLAHAKKPANPKQAFAPRPLYG